VAGRLRFGSHESGAELLVVSMEDPFEGAGQDFEDAIAFAS
jgi:hypothetical protein